MEKSNTPAEGTMGVTGRPSTAPVAQVGDPPGVGMDNLGPDSEGYNRRAEFIDRNSHPRQPTYAQLPPRVSGPEEVQERL